MCGEKRVLRDKRLQRKWIKALRSGKFTQGTGSLREEQPDGVDYCCLGVLCEVAGVSKRRWHQRILPGLHLTRELGLNLDLVWSLADMNDRGCSFNVIANELERNLEAKWKGDTIDAR
jgi:hypothetical protein